MLFKVKIIGSIILLVVIAGFITHYRYLIDKKVELEQIIQTKELIISEQKAALDGWQKAISEMAKVNREALKGIRDLNNVFSKHNLEVLADKKPGLIEKHINNGTNATLRLLECSTDRNCSTKTPGSNSD